MKFVVIFTAVTGSINLASGWVWLLGIIQRRVQTERRKCFFPVLCCCCYSVAKSCLTLRPMNCSMPGFPVLHYLLEFHVRWVSDWASDWVHWACSTPALKPVSWQGTHISTAHISRVTAMSPASLVQLSRILGHNSSPCPFNLRVSKNFLLLPVSLVHAQFHKWTYSVE